MDDTIRLFLYLCFVFFLQRAAYAPKNFLEASRPPWFNVGSQQDCSEYLRFLLDRYSSVSSRLDELKGLHIKHCEF